MEQPSETEIMTITTLYQVNTMKKQQYLPTPIKKILVDWLELHHCPTVTRSTSPSLLGGVRRSQVCTSDCHYHPVVRRDLSLTVSTPNVVSVEKTSETWTRTSTQNKVIKAPPCPYRGSTTRGLEGSLDFGHYPVVTWSPSTPPVVSMEALCGARLLSSSNSRGNHSH